MTTKYHTVYSTYEVDRVNHRARRLTGINDPTSRFNPEGEWKTYRSFHQSEDGLVFIWDETAFTSTSPLVSSEK